MKVLITGGHITPALAVVDELKNADIVFVGRKFALSSDRTHSFEYKEVAGKGYKFIDLPAGRLTRSINAQTLINILKIPVGFIKAFMVVHQQKPDIVLTFGGYIALPIAVASYLHRTPIVTHEQTILPGTANRFIGKLARKVFVSFPEAIKYFPSSKTVISGNPIREEIRSVKNKISNFKKTKPVLFVTGGSLGSHDLNTLVFEILSKLLTKYTVIHQTGSTTEFRDDERAKSIKSDLYFSFDHIESNLVGFIYEQADMVICRAGANTIFELLALKKPAVLVPLPWSAFGEQQKHAAYMKSLGVAEVFDQASGSEALLLSISEMYKELEKYKKNFDTIKLPYDSTTAAKQIAEEVLAGGSKSSTH